MFAYRHAFHAGNHADILKHVALLAVIRHMQEKPVPIWIIDTHAGAGLYALHAPLVRDKAEYGSGIGKLWEHDRSRMPKAVADLVEMVAAFNRTDRLTHYPGSPLLAMKMLRPDDRLRAFEMHPSDIGPLEKALQGPARQIKAERKDGFEQLRALLPPASRRGLVLIDPPYELKDDYRKCILALRDGLTRFASGVYMLWYPRIARYQVDRLLRQLAGLPIRSVMLAELRVRGPLRDGLGLQGSGLVIINPPFGLAGQMASALPFLATSLAQDRQAGFTLRSAEGDADVIRAALCGPAKSAPHD
jgi:23S rRNA (adenine2030-N6)-methyltransferase